MMPENGYPMTSRSAAPLSSTYRLQLTDHFTLHDAANVVPYLAQLGVRALYLSPLLKAMAGSQHGYDVVDHSLVDPARGGEKGLQALSEACGRTGLAVVVDIVPNHMGVADPAQNRAWWELLRLGPEAERASWFDVDWAFGHGRVLLPVLADDFEADRDLSLDRDELLYADHRYPLAPGSRQPGDTPAAVHQRQHYELISARRADTDQNYRRFFAITDLAGLRVEDLAVHDATHREILRWVRELGVAGLRVDHPDGLAEPGEYLDHLVASAPEAWVTVEKILQVGEELPANWPVAGTTGYDALAQVNAVLVDPPAEPALDGIYRALTGDEAGWKEHVAAGKRHVATTILQAEFRRLARLVPAVRDAAVVLTELAVVFPVYRSYLPEGAPHLTEAVDAVRRAHPELMPSTELLLPRLCDPRDELCVRFQQLTGAVMAKGVEDTAFYRYTRFIALNEVGADPGQFGLDVPAFHAVMARRQEVAPRGMTTLSTHDTKRGEDLRARLAVLAELPDEWADTARRLQQLVTVPNQAFGYLLWQSFVATGLIERARVQAFAEKAMREASDGTSWADPVPAFEQAVHAAVDAAYDRPEVRELVELFARRIEPYGWSNALTQKLVQLTMPGVPDVYQGSELCEESLVDPDNRRPVDFDRLESTLNGLERLGAEPPAIGAPSAKLWVTRQALHARRDHPEWFATYRPLQTGGLLDAHVVAFDRGGAITVATRLPVGLERQGGWGDAGLTLPDGVYRDALTGARHQGNIVLLADVLARYPVALLLPEQSS
jgi:(1->4)-alpha-D-glucan 1-alpha-D-glucosylmutase